MDNSFDGFMPLIKNISVSSLTQSLGSNAELVDVHCIKITTVEGLEFVFSISQLAMHKLSILIVKALMSDV
jgi:hypothetical protein